MSTQQSAIDTLTTQVTAAVAGLGQIDTAVKAVEAEIAQLKGQNPSLDLTALMTAVGQLGAAVGQVNTDLNPPAPPAAG